MITLPHQVEFMSDGWLDEAKRFLERETVTRKDRLGGSRAFLGQLERKPRTRRRT